MRRTESATPAIGVLTAGALDGIGDVAGVCVGHTTLDDGAIQTGVTVIRPHDGDVYRDKVPAAVCVINGFDKSVGLMQIQELGVLETPIGLTNTFGVSAVSEAQIRSAIDANPEIGRSGPTLNPLVLECNDGYLNDLHAFAVTDEHYRSALSKARPEFERGAIVRPPNRAHGAPCGGRPCADRFGVWARQRRHCARILDGVHGSP